MSYFSDPKNGAMFIRRGFTKAERMNDVITRFNLISKDTSWGSNHNQNQNNYLFLDGYAGGAIQFRNVREELYMLEAIGNTNEESREDPNVRHFTSEQHTERRPLTFDVDMGRHDRFDDKEYLNTMYSIIREEVARFFPEWDPRTKGSASFEWMDEESKEVDINPILVPNGARPLPCRATPFEEDEKVDPFLMCVSPCIRDVKKSKIQKNIQHKQPTLAIMDLEKMREIFDDILDDNDKKVPFGSRKNRKRKKKMKETNHKKGKKEVTISKTGDRIIKKSSNKSTIKMTKHTMSKTEAPIVKKSKAKAISMEEGSKYSRRLQNSRAVLKKEEERKLIEKKTLDRQKKRMAESGELDKVLKVRYKTGIHIVFPFLLVTNETGMVICENVLKAIELRMAPRPEYNSWDKVIDAAIYEKRGMRMNGALKCGFCNCNRNKRLKNIDQDVENRDWLITQASVEHEITNGVKVMKNVKFTDTSNDIKLPCSPKEEDVKNIKSKQIKDIEFKVPEVDVDEGGRCKVCFMNSGRTIDNSKYHIQHIFTGPLKTSILDTRILLKDHDCLKRVKKNSTLELVYTSVRRPLSSDEDLAPYVPYIGHVKPENHRLEHGGRPKSTKRLKVVSSDRASIAAQKLIHAAFHGDYGDTVVRGVSSNGSTVFIKTNSRACKNLLSGEHSNTTIYFMVDGETKKLYQRCFCSCNTRDNRKSGFCRNFSEEDDEPVSEDILIELFPKLSILKDVEDQSDEDVFDLGIVEGYMAPGGESGEEDKESQKDDDLGNNYKNYNNSQEEESKSSSKSSELGIEVSTAPSELTLSDLFGTSGANIPSSKGDISPHSKTSKNSKTSKRSEKSKNGEYDKHSIAFSDTMLSYKSDESRKYKSTEEKVMSVKLENEQNRKKKMDGLNQSNMKNGKTIQQNKAKGMILKSLYS